MTAVTSTEIPAYRIPDKRINNSEPVNLNAFRNRLNTSNDGIRQIPEITTMEDISSIAAYGSLTVETAYGIMKVSIVSTEEEIRRVVMRMEKRHAAFKYYSSVWSISAVVLCAFVVSGIGGLIGPVTTCVGTLFSAVGVVGSYVDWRGWLKRHAD